MLNEDLAIFFPSRHSPSACHPRRNSAVHYDKSNARRSRERPRAAFIKPAASHRCNRGMTSEIGLQNVFGDRISGSCVALQIFPSNAMFLRCVTRHRKIKYDKSDRFSCGGWELLARIIRKIKDRHFT